MNWSDRSGNSGPGIPIRAEQPSHIDILANRPGKAGQPTSRAAIKLPSVGPASDTGDPIDPRLATFVDYYRRILGVRKDCFFLAYPYLNVLVELAKSRADRKRISVTGVGLETDVPPTTVLRALGELEHVGMIRRIPDPGDGRRVFVDLTPQGLDDLAAVADRIFQIVAAFSSVVPPT